MGYVRRSGSGWYNWDGRMVGTVGLLEVNIMIFGSNTIQVYAGLAYLLSRYRTHQLRRQGN